MDVDSVTWMENPFMEISSPGCGFPAPGVVKVPSVQEPPGVQAFSPGWFPDRLSLCGRPTNGHNNKIKVIKKQMYGKCKFDLLRLKILC